MDPSLDATLPERATRAASSPPGRRTRLLVAVALTVAGCAAHRPPEAGESTGLPPALAGRSVMVLPVQAVAGPAGDPDAELAFALESRSTDVEWVLLPALRRALESSPSLDARLEGLPVGMFLRTEVRRVGDPLYGVIRRLGALTGAQVALIPVMVRYRPAGTGEDREGTAEIAAALVDVRSGYVLWFGVEGGEPGPADDPGVLASAMDALARRMVGGPTAGRRSPSEES